MNIKEFGKWPPYNVSGDNPKYSVDEFNKSFIKERFECPKEYEGSDFGEYYSVPKMSESFDKLSERKSGDDSSKSSQSKKTNKMRQRMLQQVVGLVAGSVVITTSYQAAVNRQAQQSAAQPDDTGTKTVSLVPNWEWSDDYLTVKLELTDKSGKFVKEITAVVSISEEEATCNTEGTKTYKATAEDDGHTYSDEKSETLPALGHSFGEVKQTVLDDGRISVTRECERCHEEYGITTNMTEND